MKLFENKKLAIGTGLWISPTGQYNIVKQSHIDDIMNNPSTFGVTAKWVHDLFAKYNEPLGLEGKAREEIILHVLKSGWIRLRNYRNYWSITVHRLDLKQTRSVIKSWLEEFSKVYTVGPYEEFRIVEIDRNKMKAMSKTDILSNALFEQHHVEITLVERGYSLEKF